MYRYFWLSVVVMTASMLNACALEQAIDPCTKGDKKCEGNVFYECLLDGETWDKTVCDSHHSLGAFCNAQRICVACNEDKDCQSDDKHCVEHACQPLSVVPCIEGSTRCQGLKTETCMKKAWENPMACSNGCNAGGTACLPLGACIPNETKCAGGKLLSCSGDGFWAAEATDCAQGEQCLDAGLNCTPVIICIPNERKCLGGVYSQCKSDGTWEKGSDCAESLKVCDDAKGCVECTTNDHCKAPNLICNTTSNICQACVVGTKKCEVSSLFTCTNEGQWAMDVDCSTKSQICHDAKGCIECITSEQCKDPRPICNVRSNVCLAPDAVCAPNESKCDGTTFKKCNATESGFITTFCGVGTPPYCDAIKGCVECIKSGDCKDLAKPVCNSKLNICQACVTGTKKCEGFIFEECMSGAWISVKCTSEQACDSNKGCVAVSNKHLHDFENCHFLGMTKYTDGNCIASNAPDLGFVSGQEITSGIDGKSLKLAEGGVAQIKVSKGVGELSLMVRPGSIGVFNFQVSVGGDVIFAPGDLMSQEGGTLTHKAVNISGNVEIMIDSKEYIIIDQLEWTDYP